MIRFGPAGWAYTDWNGVVYPKPKPKGFDLLEFLSDHFDTIEVNSTFYGPATRKAAVRWAERTQHNPAFRFTAKLWRRFTHDRSTAWTRAEVREAREALDLLHERTKLGAVLMQFPWSFRHDEGNRAWLDDLFTAFDDLPLVLEVRHTSWHHPAFLGELKERRVGFVNIDQPLFRDSIGPSAHATAPIGYVRVHGRNYRDWWRRSAPPHARYDYLYSADELKPWADRAKQVDADPETEDVYVVTNNHYRGKAVANALMLKSMTTKKKVESPPALLDAYREVLGPFVRKRRKSPAASRKET
jgi:uncharacterized protein YecE (DUF72 family)